MTREEAIEFGLAWLELNEDCEGSQTYEFIKMAIKALKQEPCEDVISRQAVLDYIYNDLGLGDEENGNDVERQVELDNSYRYIKSLPPVIPQPKTGHWIAKDGKEQGYDIAGIKTWYIQIMCSECGFIKTAIEGHTGHYKYCPNCGIKMQEEVWVNG